MYDGDLLNNWKDYSGMKDLLWKTFHTSAVSLWIQNPSCVHNWSSIKYFGSCITRSCLFIRHWFQERARLNEISVFYHNAIFTFGNTSRKSFHESLSITLCKSLQINSVEYIDNQESWAGPEANNSSLRRAENWKVSILCQMEPCDE